MKKLIFFLIFLCSINIHAQWVFQSSGVTTSLRSVIFYNQNIGLTVGLGGKILKTTNGGLLWNVVNSGTTQDLYSVAFFDLLNVYACGANGMILRSTDGGTSWVQTASGITTALRSLLSIYTAVYHLILAIGDNGVIINSTDGISWSRDTSSTTKQLNSSTYFNNGSSGFGGYVAGNNGTMLNSYANLNTDVNYIFSVDPTFPATSENLLGMASTYYLPFSFFDRDLIYVCTDGGKIFKTRIDNTPITPWTQINSGVNVPLRSMATHYSGKVWAVGDNGNIIYSVDTGNTWTSQNSFTTSNFYSIFMLDSIHGWIVGDGGTISNTINGGSIGIQQISTEIPSGYSLLQNYPNPFNPSTKFKFQISKLSNAKLVVFDILGKEVSTLVNEQLKPGTYEVDFDGSKYASGIYYYKFVAGDYVETKKMVLVK
jgi:hypothetical protein